MFGREDVVDLETKYSVGSYPGYLTKGFSGVSEEVPALPVILDLTSSCDVADRSESWLSTPRVCGAKRGVGNRECDIGIDAKYTMSRNF